VEQKAFRLREEYAWQKKDLESIFDYFIKAGIAILGGEAWVVRKLVDLALDEPRQRNLDPKYRQDLSILSRTQTHVIYGNFPFQDGSSAVFSWDTSPRLSSQSWQDYVKMTVGETVEVIRKGDVERQVIPRYSENIYYNLVFEEEPHGQK
jgi:hypothetical protein